MSWENNRKFHDVRTIYLDFDGTLHNSIIIYAPSFKKAYDYLVESGKAKPRIWKDEEISGWLGFTRKEMWDSFMKDLEEQHKNQAGMIIGREMQELMLSGQAHLYENSLHVLSELKKRGFCLVFLSNCSIRYMEASAAAFNLHRYFDDMICSEMYDFIPKHEILSLIKKDYPMNQVMVGDRYHDMEAAAKNSIYSVFCSYGYGRKEEGEGASACIGSILELLSIV
ncbi:MAG: HAD family hydrolase [Sedimentibacter sp.]|uniref:HAD family hydrolase n=1 Tax=Sedimentibacter sp. TaxID=1960295 RepID=UPI003158C448